jgi:hypothetical protein
MSTLYERFYTSVMQSSANATIIFLIALLAVLGYHALAFVPARWRPFAKLAAWIYAVVILAATVKFSGG